MVLFPMKSKNTFNYYIHYLIYFICATSYTLFIDISMPDDGLRHIAFAANKETMVSWGNVYPFSLFSDYDPWFGWHTFLNILLTVIPYEKIHLVINLFSLFILMVLCHETIKKYSKYDFSSLLYIVVFIVVMLSSYRYVMVRPDLLSGLYIMTALLLANRFVVIFILTIFYIPFYYLFFLYTGSIGLVYLVQKKFKAFLGVFLGSIVGLAFHLIYDYDGYIDTVINILTDQKLRMGLAVKEGLPIFDILRGADYYILIPIFLITPFFIIWKKYDYFKENSLALFLLLTSLLWVNQHRYFHLFLPLIMIYSLTLIINLDKKIFFYNLRKYLVISKKYFNYSKTKKLFYIIAIPYSIVMLTIIFSDQSFNKFVEKGKYYQDERFNNKTILYNKMYIDMFRAHYYNQKIKIVPSCSIGWFEQEDKEMKRLYVKLQSLKETVTEQELKRLIDYVNADYYIHFFKNEKQSFSFDKLNSLGIIADEITDNKIVFKIKK